MNANKIVSKIRENFPNDNPMYQQPDREYQVNEIQKILDRGIKIHIVDKPVVKYKDKIFSLYSYLIDGEIIVPPNACTVIFWCWYKLPDGKEIIRITHDHPKEEKNEMKIEVEDLKKINMLPGETLIVRYEIPAPRKSLEGFRKGFHKMFPDNKLMIIPTTMEIYKLISEEE